ncbi:MAG: LacI family DNA-binding transcriptional regulator [Cyclobacteriaceae bacterium]
MKKKNPTLLDIAEKLKITPSTVSRALNNHPRISETTRKQVLKMAAELHYEPNKIASALRSGKSKLVGIVVPTVNRNFFSSVIRGIEAHTEKLGYHVILSQSYDDAIKEKQIVQALVNAGVDGVIASLGKNTTEFNHFQEVVERGIPLVLFDRVTDKLDVSQVMIDDYLGAYQAVEHLISQGCQRIVHLTNFRKINIYKERLRGYQDALNEYKIPFDRQLVIESNMQLVDGRKSMENLLKKGINFDAVFSASDYSIMGAMQVLIENGIKIPEKVKLVGFGNEPFTSFTSPSISTVDQRSIAMGQITAEIFFELLEKPPTDRIPQKTILKPELIKRGSSVSELKSAKDLSKKIIEIKS